LRWEGSSKKYREMVKIKVETAFWVVFPLESRKWSSVIWMELKNSRS